MGPKSLTLKSHCRQWPLNWWEEFQIEPHAIYKTLGPSIQKPQVLAYYLLVQDGGYSVLQTNPRTRPRHRGQRALQPWTEAAPTREQIPGIATKYVPWPERGIADKPLSTENADSGVDSLPLAGRPRPGHWPSCASVPPSMKWVR